MNESKMIKIYISDKETVWAYKKGPGCAEINSVPFIVSNVGYEDIVEYETTDGIHRYVKTITAKNFSVGIEWESSSNKDKKVKMKEWHEIIDYLKSKDLQFESLTIGVFVISFPIGTTKEHIIYITDNSPISLTPNLDNDNLKEEKRPYA